MNVFSLLCGILFVDEGSLQEMGDNCCQRLSILDLGMNGQSYYRCASEEVAVEWRWKLFNVGWEKLEWEVDDTNKPARETLKT